MSERNTYNLQMFIRFSVATALTLSAAAPAFAQESILQTSAGAFSLSAVKVEQQPATQPVALTQWPSPVPLQAVPPDPFPARANERKIPSAALTAAALQAANKASRPTGLLEDYNVNWSPWMAVLANRWFGNLQLAEAASGLRFHTARPALIQFTCYADGHISNLVLKQSSGIAYYDRLQAATLIAATPLPPFPPGTERKSLTLVQGWESHRKEAGDRDFEPTDFASRFPQEKVSRWVTSQKQ